MRISSGQIAVALVVTLGSVLAGCTVPPAASTPTTTSQPAPTLTSIPPTPTPSPVPTPTATPPPAIPTSTPTPEPVDGRNLHPYSPSDWDGPVVANATEASRSGGPVDLGGPIYINWAYGNDGTEQVVGPYFVDIYLDGVLVKRWNGAQIRPGFFIDVTDWADLLDRVSLSPGTHELRFVLDPLDQVSETDETDNTYSIDLLVTGASAPLPTGRLPDLRPLTPEGWSAPLVATSYPTAVTHGPLSIEVTTYLLYALENAGPVSALGDVRVQVSLDGVVVIEDVWRSLRSGSRIAEESRSDELLGLLDLEPGVHTIELTIDPGNVIAESDETNNTYTAEFVWETGPVALERPLLATPPSGPPHITLPNLKPDWQLGTDRPLIVASQSGSERSTRLTRGDDIFFSAYVLNESWVDTGPFEVALYYDDVLVSTLRSDGARAGFVNFWADRRMDGVPTATRGTHTMRFVIDPTNQVAESDESDNTFEITFEVPPGFTAPPPSDPPTTSELDASLDGLRDLLDDPRPVLGEGGSGAASTLLEAAAAGYFLATGRVLADDPIDTMLFDKPGFHAAIDAGHLDNFALATPQEYASVLEAREALKSIPGFKTVAGNRIVILVDASRPFADSLNTVAHELGHALQAIVNPDQTDPSSVAFDAVHEAQAQVFERVFWLAIQDYLGTDLMTYPAHETFSAHIDFVVDRWEADLTEEHNLGYLLAWTAVLVDVSISHLGDALQSERGLDLAQTKELYDHLVGLDVSTVVDYVDARREFLDSAADWARVIAKERLDEDAGQNEGSSDTFTPALLMP